MCTSYFIDKHSNEVLENDIIKWVDLNDIDKYNLHPTQIELFNNGYKEENSRTSLVKI